MQCGEREFAGFRLLRRLDPATITADHAQWLWEHVQQCEESFDDFARGQIDYFIVLFQNPANEFYQIEDAGLVILSNLFERGAGEVHYMTWNREWGPERQKLVAREVFDYVFLERRIHHLMGMIPANNALAARFALSVGMKFEGEIRENFLFHGTYYATHIYGLLDYEYEIRRGRL